MTSRQTCHPTCQFKRYPATWPASVSAEAQQIGNLPDGRERSRAGGNWRISRAEYDNQVDRHGNPANAHDKVGHRKRVGAASVLPMTKPIAAPPRQPPSTECRTGRPRGNFSVASMPFHMTPPSINVPNQTAAPSEKVARAAATRHDRPRIKGRVGTNIGIILGKAHGSKQHEPQQHRAPATMDNAEIFHVSIGNARAKTGMVIPSPVPNGQPVQSRHVKGRVKGRQQTGDDRHLAAELTGRCRQGVLHRHLRRQSG